MRSLSLATIILLAAGCGGGLADIPDMPPVSIGGGGSGVSLMTGGKTPDEVYDNAYSRLTGYHLKLRPLLTSRDPNVLGVHETLKQIVGSLETMQALTVDPWKKDIQPQIDWYRSYVNASSHTGSFLDETERRLRHIKTHFNPGVVELVAALPDEKGDEKPAPPDADPKPEAPKPAPPVADVQSWMLYSAWKQAHNDLTDAFTRGADCARPYQRVQESLAALKARLPEERRPKLALCASVYEQQNDETSGFTKLPDGSKREDVSRVLENVARMMAEYDPDKK